MIGSTRSFKSAKKNEIAKWLREYVLFNREVPNQAVSTLD